MNCAERTNGHRFRSEARRETHCHTISNSANQGQYQFCQAIGLTPVAEAFPRRSLQDAAGLLDQMQKWVCPLLPPPAVTALLLQSRRCGASQASRRAR